VPLKGSVHFYFWSALFRVKMAKKLFWLCRLLPEKSVSMLNKAIPKNIEELLPGDVK
jgi:hypothetical protein